MADPVAKAKYEELKTTYNTLQSRLREIESEMFDMEYSWVCYRHSLKRAVRYQKHLMTGWRAHHGL